MSILLEHPERAARFVVDELGALASDTRQNAPLRQTLGTYLGCHSPSTVADKLYIARNTVSYRLRKIEEILGYPPSERSLELALALRMHELLPRR